MPNDLNTETAIKSLNKRIDELQKAAFTLGRELEVISPEGYITGERKDAWVHLEKPWIHYHSPPVDWRQMVMLEVHGGLTKDIIAHIAKVDGMIISGSAATLSWNISVPKEVVDETKKILISNNVSSITAINIE